MTEATGFLKAKGQKVVNGEGQEILLRGVAFGGWLLPEGYMWCFPDQGDRPRRIERMIEELIGRDRGKEFWRIYYTRYTSEADIRQIAAEGFNSVRVPINARFILEGEAPIKYNEEHLKLIDAVICWCRKYRLYVILDLHGAPGGQTGTNIDDSENDTPELFLQECYKNQTLEIWRMLAERYKEEWIVAGYDLLNEPLPNWFSAYNNKIMPLYKEIVKAIRDVDQRHMIILEGAHWATDWSIFNESIDDNVMLQFHKYWNNPDIESIQAFLDKRNDLNVPIFMGEGGENNVNWFIGAFRMYEDQDIAWNFWTWKKMGKSNSPCIINKPLQWQLLVDYLEGGTKPDKKTAESILWQYLDNISFDCCVYHKEVVNALFRRPPVLIPAVFYGYRGAGVSYSIKNKRAGSIEFRINDGMDIRFIEATGTKPNFQHMQGEEWKPEEWMFLQLYPEEWLVYEFSNEPACPCSSYKVLVSICAPDGEGQLTVFMDDTEARTTMIYNTSWEVVDIQGEFALGAGCHKITLRGEKDSLGLKWIQIVPV